MQNTHNLVADALAAGASTFEPGAAKETRLHTAIEPELEFAFPEDTLVSRKGARLNLPGWAPQPGQIDVRLLREDGTTRLAFELKVDEIGQSLWDMLKMAAAARDARTEAAYVVVAATARSWSHGRRAGTRFFRLSTGARCEVSLAELFAEYRREWRWHLAHDTGRVREFPDALELMQLGTFPAHGGYEVRALAVRDAPDCAFRTQSSGWPTGLTPAADDS
ncbi:MAG TPA: hypothetical protein VH459_08425 [Gaiellales bacterium]